MTREVTIFVEFMAPSFNSIYAGTHWAKRKKQADAGHKAVAAHTIVPFTVPVRLEFTPVVGKGGRVRDCSNYAYTAKIIEDGLVKAGVLVDDSPEYVRGFAIEEPEIDRKRKSGMRVVIKECEAVSSD